MPTDFPDAGMYGGPASLPSGAGPVDPPILTGNYPSPSPTPLPVGPADYFTRIDPNMGYINPSLTIYPGSDNYPAPGTGAGTSGQGVLGRIFSSTPAGLLYNLLSGHVDRIPAVQLAQSIGRLLNPGQSWRQNAASNSSGGGPAAAVAPAPTPDLGAMDQTERFAEGSGTGNFVADQTTKYWEAAGGYAGNPNRMPVGDAGRSLIYPAQNAGGRPAGGPAITTNPASVAAYNAWLTQQPEYQAWLARNGQGPAGVVPGITISGAPGGGG